MRVIVLLRGPAAGCAAAGPLTHGANAAIAPAASPVFMRSRRAGLMVGSFLDMADFSPGFRDPVVADGHIRFFAREGRHTPQVRKDAIGPAAGIFGLNDRPLVLGCQVSL